MAEGYFVLFFLNGSISLFLRRTHQELLSLGVDLDHLQLDAVAEVVGGLFAFGDWLRGRVGFLDFDGFVLGGNDPETDALDAD